MWYFRAVDNHQCSEYIVSVGGAAVKGDIEYLNLGRNLELCDWVYWDKYFGRGAVAILGVDFEGDSLALYDSDRVYRAGDTGRVIGAIIWRKRIEKW